MYRPLSDVLPSVQCNVNVLTEAGSQIKPGCQDVWHNCINRSWGLYLRICASLRQRVSANFALLCNPLLFCFNSKCVDSAWPNLTFLCRNDFVPRLRASCVCISHVPFVIVIYCRIVVIIVYCYSCIVCRENIVLVHFMNIFGDIYWRLLLSTSDIIFIDTISIHVILIPMSYTISEILEIHSIQKLPW